MTEIRAVQADITALDVDAVVNAANVHLQHGGGVADAIARAGGPVIQEESDAWVERNGPLAPGQAAVTTAGEMPARIVVHVAGPIHQEGQNNEGLLRQAVEAALDAAASGDCRSIAIPAISSGIYGYPKSEATAVIADECRAWTNDRPDTFDQVLLVGYDAATAEEFGTALRGS
jgi:O-acetyl-ADP-ribose deacetylase (regulator of RNase III)